MTVPEPGVVDVGREGLLFGYHMPTQTFPEVRAEGLFERIVADV